MRACNRRGLASSPLQYCSLASLPTGTWVHLGLPSFCHESVTVAVGAQSPERFLPKATLRGLSLSFSRGSACLTGRSH